MVIGLVNIKSSNDGNGKMIHATVVNDGTAAIAILRATIGSSVYVSEAVSLPANARQGVTIRHDQAGWRLVELQEQSSGTRADCKVLNLDLPEYSHHPATFV